MSIYRWLAHIWFKDSYCKLCEIIVYHNIDKKGLDKVEAIIGFNITRSEKRTFLWISQSWEDLKEM